MASYDDDGEWHVDRPRRLQEEAFARQRARIDSLMEKVVIRLASGGQEYCEYCGSAVGPQYTGAHTSHKAWHLFIFEALFQRA